MWIYQYLADWRYSLTSVMSATKGLQRIRATNRKLEPNSDAFDTWWILIESCRYNMFTSSRWWSKVVHSGCNSSADNMRIIKQLIRHHWIPCDRDRPRIWRTLNYTFTLVNFTLDDQSWSKLLVHALPTFPKKLAHVFSRASHRNCCNDERFTDKTSNYASDVWAEWSKNAK